MSGVNINASRCIDYLRSIGVHVSNRNAADWNTQEQVHRDTKRRHNRELKKSCGHFRTYECDVHGTEGSEVVTYCHDCRKCVAHRPMSPRGPSGGGEPLPVERIA